MATISMTDDLYFELIGTCPTFELPRNTPRKKALTEEQRSRLKNVVSTTVATPIVVQAPYRRQQILAAEKSSKVKMETASPQGHTYSGMMADHSVQVNGDVGASAHPSGHHTFDNVKAMHQSIQINGNIIDPSGSASILAIAFQTVLGQ